MEATPDGGDRCLQRGGRQALEIVLVPLIMVPFDEAAIWDYGELRAELERRGTPIGSLVRSWPQPRTLISKRGWCCLLELAR